jgi:Carboxypeptidase regulatory-like domain
MEVCLTNFPDTFHFLLEITHMLSLRKSGVRFMQLATLALLFAIPALAQTTATIVGTITDSNGAILPGAQVTARNVDTALTRTVSTGEAGAYRIEFLPVGNYVVEVSANGLTKSNRTGIVLQVNDTARVDVSLTVGPVSENVTITEAAPAINTSSAEIGRTIDSTEITNLPLVERNVYALLDLTPGVQSNNNGVASASTGTNSLILGFPEQRTLINGGVDGGTGSVNYYLDGGNNMTNLRNTGNSLPNPDAIQEFRVQTNSYNAEYGRFANGIINVLTKSGTNKIQHLSMFAIRSSTPMITPLCWNGRRLSAINSAVRSVVLFDEIRLFSLFRIQACARPRVHF